MTWRGGLLLQHPNAKNPQPVCSLPGSDERHSSMLSNPKQYALITFLQARINQRIPFTYPPPCMNGLGELKSVIQCIICR